MRCLTVMLAGLLSTSLALPETGLAEISAVDRHAIGQISYGANRAGSAICTGTLVTERLVLTAAHCLRSQGNGQAMDPTDVTFAPGWQDGAAPLLRRGAEVILSGGSGLASDLALLVLDAPVPSEIALPIPLVQGQPAGTLSFIGYDREKPERQYQATCPLLGAEGNVLGLGCEAVSGNSGAPLLEETPQGWRLAGVMVARSRLPGPIGSFAVVPGAEIIAHISQP